LCLEHRFRAARAVALAGDDAHAAQIPLGAFVEKSGQCRARFVDAHAVQIEFLARRELAACEPA
jgi:hypothetical protein